MASATSSAAPGTAYADRRRGREPAQFDQWVPRRAAHAGASAAARPTRRGPPTRGNRRRRPRPTGNVAAGDRNAGHHQPERRPARAADRMTDTTANAVHFQAHGP